MVVAFFLSTAGLLSSVKTEVLFNTIAEGEQSYLPYLLTALPVCLVSFGFHGNVPSLVKYYDRDGSRVMKSDLYWYRLSLSDLHLMAACDAR